ncbi:MAG: 16S rRNA (guanine(966)-N(2))-methyltransferase RsmD [Lachnospiraceae bacterium]|nr:16S rRNA (guanine(966)-N(2))-methyltransferase RsmD [Lachnospiraceae bacterium]
MRVIAGSRRSIRLTTVKGDKVRPTTDRIKETLFNILQPDIPGASFLDLFSGSGAIGIEALSRGAKEAVLVEQDREALTCIRTNLKATRFEAEAQVKPGDVISVLRTLQHAPFDLIFMDPPYDLGLEEKVLTVLSQVSYVDEYTKIIVEASVDTDMSYAESLGFSIYREKSYGSNKHIFLEKRQL